MTTVITYQQQRNELFGLRTKTDSITVAVPTKTTDDHKRYHIYVFGDNTKEQKVHSSFTLEEAKALIQYEREEYNTPAQSNTVQWGEYAKQFKWIVKDTKEFTTYNYNPTTSSLELNLL